jgi:glycosyltransferase involved in cell wall biosynthesis
MKLALVVTEDWYVVSHWLAAAQAAREAGHEVIIVTRVAKHRAPIEQKGFRIVDWQSRRGSRNPFGVLASLWQLSRILREERVEVVHNISIQCAVIGGIAATFSGAVRIVNGINGFGYLSVSNRWRNRLLLGVLLRFIVWFANEPHAVTTVPNDTDRFMLSKRANRLAKIVKIPGIGIDTRRFAAQPPSRDVVVALVARMLREKGVVEFAEAARLVKAAHPEVRFWLVGGLDPSNPGALAEAEIERWVTEGIIEWRGHVDDVPAIWREANIAVLPSYREGLPTALLEAASCGRALIAADVPGCNDVVRNEINGLLVPVRTIAPLAEAITRLIEDADLRALLGATARQLVEQSYSKEVVTACYRHLYSNL